MQCLFPFRSTEYEIHIKRVANSICENTTSKSDYTFPHIIQKYTKFANFTGLHFPHFTQSKLHQFNKFRMLFFSRADIPNLKVCLNGKWSINVICAF